jgi:hypothetical protein
VRLVFLDEQWAFCYGNAVVPMGLAPCFFETREAAIKAADRVGVTVMDDDRALPKEHLH